MAHFAQLDSDNVVIQTIVVHNSVCLDENGIEREDLGVSFCRSTFGQDTNWVQTSYNNNFRANFAGVGFTYDESADAFVPIKPYPSWVLNSEYRWDAPVPYPADGNNYRWDESGQSWELVHGN